ncbi:MAG: helix-turn-helix domain-containing protein [Phycisphaeraceae bacterium]|nr:MAG: helix-turn-helix domain-containing protein [Phycisphaeraceae bacterium]
MTTPILTNAEAARWLRLDDDYPGDPAAATRALHRLVRAGRLRPLRGVGPSYRFHVDELERFARAETERVDAASDSHAEGSPAS